MVNTDCSFLKKLTEYSNEVFTLKPMFVREPGQNTVVIGYQSHTYHGEVMITTIARNGRECVFFGVTCC